MLPGPVFYYARLLPTRPGRPLAGLPRAARSRRGEWEFVRLAHLFKHRLAQDSFSQPYTEICPFSVLHPDLHRLYRNQAASGPDLANSSNSLAFSR